MEVPLHISDQIRMRRLLPIALLTVLFFLNIPLIASAQSANEVAIRKLASALLSAGTDDERSALLASEKDLVTRELVRALAADGRHHYRQGAHGRALDSFAIALMIARKLDEPIEVAKVLFAVGNVKSVRGDYEQALAQFQESLSIAEELRDKALIARSMQYMAIVHASQGNYTQALDEFRKGLKMSEALGDKYGIITTLGNIGNVCRLQGNYTEALEYHERSLKLEEEEGNKNGIAKTLMNIGNVHSSLGNYSEALQCYQKSLGMKTETEDKNGIAIILLGIANVNYLQVDYSQALVNYEKSRRISTELGDKKGIAVTLSGIGNVYFAQNNYAQARQHFESSLKINEQIGDKDGIAAALNNIASVFSAQGDYIQALKHYMKSLAISEEIGDKGSVPVVLNNIGDVRYLQKRYAQARECYESSLKIAEEIGDGRLIANTLAGIGNVHYHECNYEKAIEFAERANALAKQIGLLELYPATLTTVGQANLALNQNHRARQAFCEAIAAIEELRAGVVGDERQRQQFFENKLSPFHQMVRLSIDEHKDVEALDYAERAKSRALLDTLQKGRVNITKVMSASEQEEDRKLNGQIVSLNTQISREIIRNKPDEAVLADLQARRAKVRTDYEAFQINLYARYPELRIRRGQMRRPNLDEVAGLIPNASTAILEYVVTEDQAYLFVITREKQHYTDVESLSATPSLKVYTLNITRIDLERRVAVFDGRLSNRDSGILQPARELFELLIGPARADLKDKTNLIIVPDGVLWQLPFQALQRSAHRFLIEDYAISYAPSITVLREMIALKEKYAKKTGNSQVLLAVGNPDLGQTTAERLQPVLIDERLTRLPEAEKQVKMLGRLYGPNRSKIYVGAKATEDRVKRESGGFRILQLATHGILDDNNPTYSHLVLSQSQANENEDGLLEAREITNLDLNADLIILAACNTARGRVSNGEGVIGIAWSFFVAGCPATVVSQWAVESRSTTQLMIQFHKNIKANIDGRKPGIGTAEELRRAALKLLKTRRYRHPFYWAPFVVIGDGR